MESEKQRPEGAGPPLAVSAPSAEQLVIPLVVRIRECAEADLPHLEWFGSFAHHREIFAEAYARQGRGENLMLVADARGFPVGQAWVDLQKRKAESVGVLWAVRVLPLLQGLGIGSILIRAAARRLRERGYRAAELGVEKDNAGARRLYERLGYQLVGELREGYGYTAPDGVAVRHVVDQWILRKALD